ncbi:MAG: integrin alpha, partial [Myxococcota bacterium]|nr:integrin alpha [Myxococcota bacterium]
MRFFGPGLASVLVVACAPEAAIDADTVGADDAPLDEWVDAPLDEDGVAAYVARPANDGFRAHHPPLNAQLRFEASGLEFRTGRAQTEPVTIRTTAINGERTEAAAFEPGDCIDGTAADDADTCIPAMEADHRGVTEWWHNTPAGLEQGWTVHEPLDGDTIRIDVAFDGARVKVGESGTAAAVLRPTAAPLHYAGLKAWDADGEVLDARLESADGGLSVVVDAVDAAYPVTVDPWFGTWSWSHDQGSAYMHSANTAGDVNGDGYEDLLVSSAYFDNGESDEGRIWLFLGSVDGLSSTPDWTWETNQADAHLGYEKCAVAGGMDLNGDGYSDIAVGARLYDKGQTNEGAVFVFYGSADGLPTEPDWTGESNQANAQYGTCVSSVGDVNGDGFADIAVGAPYYDNGESDEGRVWVYHGSEYGVTVLAWVGEADRNYSNFGWSVDGAGDVDGDGYDDLIVGARNFDNGHTDEGRAYVFHGSESGLETSARWTWESDRSSGWAGQSVAGLGDLNGDGFSDVMVGSPGFDGGGGRALVFLGSADGVNATDSWHISGSSSYHRY